MNFLNSKLFTVIPLALIVWILFSVISVEIEKDEVEREERSTEAKIKDISYDNEQLKRFLDNLTDPRFLEKEARLRLNYKAPDEEVIFVHRDVSSERSSFSDDFSANNLPNYKKWWYWLLVR